MIAAYVSSVDPADVLFPLSADRHTLWRHLQCVVTPLLANIVEVLDRFANLDLLAEGKLSQGLGNLWLNILADSQILDLIVPQKPRCCGPLLQPFCELNPQSLLCLFTARQSRKCL